MRAVAVLSVVAYHDDYSWAKGGFLGVDTFFVLSGFLITTLLVSEFRRASTIRFAAFWARRARRLLPALLLVLGFVALYTHLASSVGRNGGATICCESFYVANWRFIFDQRGYFQLFSAVPLRHMWSSRSSSTTWCGRWSCSRACVRRRSARPRLGGVIGVALSVLDMRLRFHRRPFGGTAQPTHEHTPCLSARCSRCCCSRGSRCPRSARGAIAAIPAAVVVLVAAHNVRHRRTTTTEARPCSPSSSRS
jgi:hypothetical protein